MWLWWVKAAGCENCLRFQWEGWGSDVLIVFCLDVMDAWVQVCSHLGRSMFFTSVGNQTSLSAHSLSTLEILWNSFMVSWEHDVTSCLTVVQQYADLHLWPGRGHRQRVLGSVLLHRAGGRHHRPSGERPLLSTWSSWNVLRHCGMNNWSLWRSGWVWEGGGRAVPARLSDTGDGPVRAECFSLWCGSTLMVGTEVAALMRGAGRHSFGFATWPMTATEESATFPKLDSQSTCRDDEGQQLKDTQRIYSF